MERTYVRLNCREASTQRHMLGIIDSGGDYLHEGRSIESVIRQYFVQRAECLFHQTRTFGRCDEKAERKSTNVTINHEYKHVAVETICAVEEYNTVGKVERMNSFHEFGHSCNAKMRFEFRSRSSFHHFRHAFAGFLKLLGNFL
jgi:hypothetical protein